MAIESPRENLPFGGIELAAQQYIAQVRAPALAIHQRYVRWDPFDLRPKSYTIAPSQKTFVRRSGPTLDELMRQPACQNMLLGV